MKDDDEDGGEGGDEVGGEGSAEGELKLLEGFCFLTDRQTDRLTDERTLVIVESLLRLKNHCI